MRLCAAFALGKQGLDIHRKPPRYSLEDTDLRLLQIHKTHWPDTPWKNVSAILQEWNSLPQFRFQKSHISAAKGATWQFDKILVHVVNGDVTWRGVIYSSTPCPNQWLKTKFEMQIVALWVGDTENWSQPGDKVDLIIWWTGFPGVHQGRPISSTQLVFGKKTSGWRRGAAVLPDHFIHLPSFSRHWNLSQSCKKLLQRSHSDVSLCQLISVCEKTHNT